MSALFVDCGCLAGDTLIPYNRAGCQRKRTIAELWEFQNNPVGHRRADVDTKVRAFDGNTIKLHPIQRVVKRGIKCVFELTLEDGKHIKATPDHEFLTQDGWKELSSLTDNDRVMVDNVKRHQSKSSKNEPKRNPDKRRAVGKYHPFARYQESHGGRSGSFLVEMHRLVYESHASDMTIDEFVEWTHTGKPRPGLVFVDTSTHCVHHINGDHYDNRPENMCLMTKEAHMAHHTLGYSNFSHGVPCYSKVVSVKRVGEEMTYDIVCHDPHRNFSANGMIVHNCGKTFMVLASTQEQFRRGIIKPGKVLICGKLATLETGWYDDCLKFTHMKPVVLWLGQVKNRREKLIELLNTPADIYIINHDGLRILEEELIKKQFDKVVIDESTILKSYITDATNAKKGKFGQSLMKVAASAKWRVIMSGTPAPNGPEDLWGQMHFIDPNGFMLEKSIHDFRALYMEVVHMGDPKNPNTPKKYIPQWDASERVADIISPVVFRAKIRDHLKDLPEETFVRRMCCMGDAQQKHYLEMEEALSTEIDEEVVDVDMVLTKLGKLRQITGGFLIDHKKEEHEIEDNPKIEMLDCLLNEEIAPENKVVIYAQYQYEVELIETRYKDIGVCSVYGGNSSTTNLANIRTFIEDPTKRLIVLHPRSAGHGITLVCAHYMIFYSISHSAEENYQSIARIKRAGQKHPMFIYYLLCKESIDEAIYEAVVQKQQRQDKLLDQAAASTELLTLWRERRKSHGKKRKGKDIQK